jgi:NDP-hexose 3,5-(Or5-) epimerase
MWAATESMAIADAFRLHPVILPDARGHFYEAFRDSEFSTVTGRRFAPVQSNFSVSRRDVLRGMHGVRLPPGQSKLVSCVRGAVLDMLVDLRRGSPTFLQSASTVLEPQSAVSVYVPNGVFHGFQALTDNSCVHYLLSEEHVPGTQVDINPLDPALRLPWRLRGAPVLSDKDAAAPTLQQAVDLHYLPSYADCLTYYRDGVSR